jgi:L-ascorbate metabolism protein UlaG (beta-lactamase superfamily)
MAKIKYWGHSCFLITTTEGLRILVDPYEAGAFGGAIGYAPVTDEVDVVLVTHEHGDHNYVAGLPGNPLVLRANGVVRGVSFVSLTARHGKPGGQDRGENRIFTWEADGVRFCHTGDLGHTFSEEQVKLLGRVDVLFVPVGGFFTIDAATAHQVAEQLQARVIIPMHFKTARLNFPLDMPIETEEAFVAGQPHVLRVGGSTWEVSRESLPAEPTIVVLDAV